MISTAQLQSLDFEFDEKDEVYSFKEIDIWFEESEIKILFCTFELYGIRDVRDLRKLIELIYGN